MVGGFACPECGRELALEGLSPGRAVQCDGCSTLVEVPFFPRAEGWKRGRGPRRRSPWRSITLRAAIGFAVVVLATLTIFRAIGGRVRSDRERVLSELVASADAAEAAGDHGSALREIEAALVQARTIDPEGSARIGELLRQRDRIALREAEVRLAGVDALDPDRSVGEALILAARVRRDPALEPLAGAIEARVASSRLRQAEADLGAARRALDLGRDPEAFEAADRLHARAARLADADARRFRAEARSIIEAAVARSGVIVPPVAGRFVAGSTEGYTAAIAPLWAESLRARGFLTIPRRSPWQSTWDEKAPFRAETRVVESQEGFYLQSRNRTTQIDGGVELFQGDRSAWQARLLARTRAPIPNLPAYRAGHLATAPRRDPEVEQYFQKDAQNQFVDLVARTLRGIPERDRAARKP